MRTIYAGILTALLPLLAFAQALDIRGVVADSASGELIPYANIVLLNTSRGAASNAYGFYLIPSVPQGTYDIAASAVGYGRQVKSVVVTGTAAITVNFRLAQRPVEMREVISSGKGRTEMLQVYPSAHVLEKAELQMVPVTGQPDIFRSIQILPGIVSTSDVNSQFYVRGGASDQNLILLDGMKIYNPFHAFGLFSIFDPDIVKTAEVFTGGFPADYGGRLSSVISILSRDGNASSFAGHANVNFLSSKLQLEGPISQNLQLIATGRKSLFPETLKRFLNQSVPLSFYDGLVKATLKRPDSQDKFSLQAFVSGDDLKSSDPEEPDYTWKSTAAAVQVNTLLQDRLFVNTVVSGSQFDQKRNPKASTSISPSSTTVREFTVRSEATYYTSSKDLYFFGFDMSFPSVEYQLVTRFGEQKTLSSTNPELGAWVRYQMQLDRLTADAGLRTEIGALLRGRSIKSGLLPRLSFSYDIDGNWKGKASYGRFSQEVVTVTNEDDVIPIFTPWIAVPDNLEAEQADHYVLGVDGNPLRNLSTTFNAYYKHYSSLVTYNRDKVDATDPDYINSTSNAYGGEALIRFSSKFIDLYAAYTLSWVRIDQSGFVYSPRYDRRHAANLLASLRLIKGVDLTMRWELGSGLPFTQSLGFYDKLTMGDLYPNPFLTETGTPYTLYGPKNAARLPAYHRLDVNVSYALTIFSRIRSALGMNIINVYNRKNVFYFERATGRRINMLGFFPSLNLTLEFLP
jgi:outer membrane cobalamin receptor